MIGSALQDLAALVEISEVLQLASVFKDSDLVVAPEYFQGVARDGGDFEPRQFVQLIISAAGFNQQSEGNGSLVDFDVDGFLAYSGLIDGSIHMTVMCQELRTW